MTYGQLPAALPNQEIDNRDGGKSVILARQPVLYCAMCGEQCSANPGDYWNVPASTEITCQCGEPMTLSWERNYVIPDARIAEFDDLIEAFFNS